MIVLRSGCAIVLVAGQSSVMVTMLGATVCCGPFMMVAGDRLVIRMDMTAIVGVGMAVAGVGRCCHDNLSGEGRNGHHKRKQRHKCAPPSLCLFPRIPHIVVVRSHLSPHPMRTLTRCVRKSDIP